MHLETLGFRDITLDTFNRDKEPVAGTLESVRSAGRLLRRVHDATVGWVPPADANWAVPFLPGDVIGHDGRDAVVSGSVCLLSGKRGVSACLIEPCAFEGLGSVQQFALASAVRGPHRTVQRRASGEWRPRQWRCS